MSLRFVTIPRSRRISGARGNSPERLAAMTPAQRKQYAYNLIGNARTHGRIQNEPCCVCGSKKAHAHHEDYANPFRVTFLCPLHHKQRHTQLRGGPKPKCMIVSFSVPEKMAGDIESRLAKTGMTRSEYVRSLLRKDWERARRTTPKRKGGKR
jgi:hypothetical protein